MKLLSKSLLLALVSSVTLASYAQTPTIGIVVPLEHPAMDEIVAGFSKELHKQYPGPVNIVVKNAQHDPTLQRMIIKQMQTNHTNIIEPIGVDAFEMTLATVKNKPIIGIAAELSEQQRLSMQPRNATTVLDEVNPTTQLQFVKQLMPSLHALALVHSADDKTVIEVAEVKKAAKQLGIQVQDVTVMQAPDMYTLSQHLAPTNDAIFVLKDHLIVSQMAILVKQAQKRHIPVIASDDGSVEQGAALALGVRESSIGVAAADVTVQVLQGTPISDIPVKKLTHYELFINPSTLASQGLDQSIIEKTAKLAGYPVVPLTAKDIV